MQSLGSDVVSNIIFPWQGSSWQRSCISLEWKRRRKSYQRPRARPVLYPLTTGSSFCRPLTDSLGITFIFLLQRTMMFNSNCKCNLIALWRIDIFSHSSEHRSRDMYSECSLDEMSEPDSNRLLRMVTRRPSSTSLSTVSNFSLQKCFIDTLMVYLFLVINAKFPHYALCSV